LDSCQDWERKEDPLGSGGGNPLGQSPKAWTIDIKRGAKNAARRGDFNVQKTITAAATIKRGGKR
jgi:hypothetical protein